MGPGVHLFIACLRGATRYQKEPSVSFPVQPSNTTSRAPVEPSSPDFAPLAPAPHASDTPTPRWSIWTLVSAICGIFTAVGAGASIFSVTAAGVLCIAAGPALVCGLVGLLNISESNGRLKGREFAVVGFVMVVVGLIVFSHMASSQFSEYLKQHPFHLLPSDD